MSEYHELSLFSAFGVELEYMIVDKESLNVIPIADKLLLEIAATQLKTQLESQAISNTQQLAEQMQVADVELGDLELSNELVLHVIELKCKEPAPNLAILADAFRRGIKHINGALSKFNAQLLPTGAHPWMNPLQESKIWPHDFSPVYEAYNRIFDCRGHGWSNLQSAHLNLPFANDIEFAKLHTAIRLLLPIIPALSASSPILNGKSTGFLDSRLEIYRNNQKMIPSVAGQIIPECIMSRKDYEQMILQPMYHDIAKYDPQGILQHEWLNSRGAIARFERNTIEIRIIDIQECSHADIAILYFIVETLRDLVSEKWCSFEEQQKLETNKLADIFNEVIKKGSNTVVDDQKYLTVFGYKSKKCTAGELWQYIFHNAKSMKKMNQLNFYIENILSYGNLAERILRAINNDFRRQRLMEVYCELGKCLAEGKLFVEY